MTLTTSLRGRTAALHFWIATLATIGCAAGDPLSAPLPPAEPPVTPRPPAEADSLLLSPSQITVVRGDTVRFRAPDSTVGGAPVSGPVEWSASGGTIDAGGLYRATTDGLHEITARRGDKTGKGRVTVTTRTLTGFAISPDSVALATGASATFTALASWSDGTSSAPTGVTWTASGGTVDGSGRFVAGTTPGTYRVIGALLTRADTAVVVVRAPQAGLTSLVISPASATVPAGGSQAFTVAAMWSDGSTTVPALSWSASGGAVSPTGLFTAPTAAGTYRVIVRATDHAVADTAVITVPAATGQVLFTESFADGNFAARGWYDNAGQPRVSAAPAGHPGSLQWSWAPGATVPTGGGAMRRRFAPTGTLYVSFRIQRSANWVGSARAYHPHEIMVLSDQDAQWAAPADTWLNLYIESNFQAGLRPVVKFQDNRAIRADAIGTVPLTNPENRAVSGCNGRQGAGVFECFAFGTSSGWYNSRGFIGSQVAAPGDSAWHRVEVYVQLNSVVGGVAQQDGIVRYWWDGQLVFEHTNVLMRAGARSSLQLNQFVFGPYIGDGSPVAQTTRIADLIVATSRQP